MCEQSSVAHVANAVVWLFFITVSNFCFALYPDHTTWHILIAQSSVQKPVRHSQVAVGFFQCFANAKYTTELSETLLQIQSLLSDLQRRLMTWEVLGFCFKAHLDLAGKFYPFSSFTLKGPTLEPFPPHSMNHSKATAGFAFILWLLNDHWYIQISKHHLKLDNEN